MNWEALGAVGEVVGAVGVIVTLVFLAYQIRQNSNLLRANSEQLEQNHQLAIADALGQSNNQQTAMLAISQHNELSDLFFRGLRNYPELSPQERMRFALLMGPLIAGVATQSERQRQLKVHGDEIGPEQIVFAIDFLAMPGGREWWSRYANRYPEHFRRAIDEALERSSEIRPSEQG